MFILNNSDMKVRAFIINRVSITRAMKVLKEAGKIILEDRRLILPALKIA